MDNDIVSMQKRIQSLRTSYAIKENKRQEDALAARRSLDLISEEDIELLKAIAPELAIVTKYTVEEIRENRNGEVEAIRAVRAKLMQYTEQRLAFYEEQL